MPNFLPDIFLKLVNEFSKLPGVGEKTAFKFALYLLKRPKEEVELLADTITKFKNDIKYCKVCNNITTEDVCSICKDPSRDPTSICVVEGVEDLIAIEKTHSFKGKYHVLHGVISPLDGIGPDDIKLKGLLDRIERGDVKEVIIATNPDIEGEGTALYIAKLLKNKGVKVTRLGYGIPVGGDLEFVDEITLSQAIEGRKKLDIEE